ncbi:hypothetical protein Plhal304r1_c007g0029691 [Plasmopara halstedii]
MLFLCSIYLANTFCVINELSYSVWSTLNRGGYFVVTLLARLLKIRIALWCNCEFRARKRISIPKDPGLLFLKYHKT